MNSKERQKKIKKMGNGGNILGGSIHYRLDPVKKDFDEILF